MILSVINDKDLIQATTFSTDGLRKLSEWKVVGAKNADARGRGIKRNWTERSLQTVAAISLLRRAGFTLPIATSIFAAWRYHDLPGAKFPTAVTRRTGSGETREESEYDKFLRTPLEEIEPNEHDRFIDIFGGKFCFERYGESVPKHFAVVSDNKIVVRKDRESSMQSADRFDLKQLPIEFAHLAIFGEETIIRENSDLVTRLNISLAIRRAYRRAADLMGFVPAS